MHLKTADTGETAGAMRHRSCMPARQKLWCMYIPSARVLPTANTDLSSVLDCFGSSCVFVLDRKHIIGFTLMRFIHLLNSSYKFT